MTEMIDRLPLERPLSGASYSAMELAPENDRVWMLEQRELPDRERYHVMTQVDQVAAGIRDMVVRGAPAIGISAAYGMVLAAGGGGDAAQYRNQMHRAGELLRSARPTAVNLGWAVDRVLSLVQQHAEADPSARVEQVAALAREIHTQDLPARSSPRAASGLATRRST